MAVLLGDIPREIPPILTLGNSLTIRVRHHVAAEGRFQFSGFLQIGLIIQVRGLCTRTILGGTPRRVLAGHKLSLLRSNKV